MIRFKLIQSIPNGRPAGVLIPTYQTPGKSVPAAINPDCYSDGFVVPGTAGLVASLVRRIGLSTVIGYLVTGAKLVPLGLGSLIGQFPLLC